MINDRRNFSREYNFSNLVYVCRSIDRAPVIRKIFVYQQKLSGAEEVCTHAEGAREDDERRFALRTVTNGSAGPSSHVPNVSHGVTIGWMSAHIGHVLFRILLPVFPCYPA